MILAIDPGRGSKATIGYCLFTEQGEEIERGSMGWGGLVGRLFAERYGLVFYVGDNTDYSISTVVIENFVNDPRVRRGGQTNGASEVIGAVEFAATQAGAFFVRQDRSILPVAKQYAQYVDTHKHLPHQDAAYLHGVYWLTTQGLWDTGVSATLGGR